MALEKVVEQVVRVNGNDFVEGVEESDGAVVSRIGAVAFFREEEDVCFEPGGRKFERPESCYCSVNEP